MNLTEKDLKSLRTLSLVSGIFVVLVGLIIILGYIQMKRIQPLENPVLVQLKEQFDNDPANKDLKEQIRSLDLMARKAFFTATWQVRMGSYLLLAGAIVFMLAQRLIASTDKTIPSFPGDSKDPQEISAVRRRWVLYPAMAVFTAAIALSFIMRNELPDPNVVVTEGVVQSVGRPAAPSNMAAAVQTTPTEEPGLVQEPATDQSPVTEQTKEAVSEPVKETVQPAATEPGPGKTFPAFRGKGSRGFAEGTGYPVNWDGSAGNGVLWKVKVPKKGYNSPVIWGSKLFLTGADATAEEIYCYNTANGSLLWTASAGKFPGAPAKSPETSEDTGLAAPTAAVNNQYVCAIFATGNLVCADHNGKVIWAKNVGVPDNHYGHSSSLLIYKGTVIVQFDHNKSATLFAFNLSNGEKAWETIRQTKISWASPVLATIGGREQLILNADPYVAGYDPNNGKEIWRAKGVSAEIGPSVGVNSTMVFAGNEFAKLLGINPAAPAAYVWEDNEYLPEVASPVATDDYLFIATSFGAAACYKASTGELLWDHEFDYGFYASPIIVGGNVYLLDQAGVMQIFKVSSKYEPVAASPLGEKAVSTPAFADSKIFIRGTSNLWCIGK